MSRNFRPHLPGHPFHITSRTQGKADWFTDDIRSTIASVIIDGVASAGAPLYAHAVMSNHIHVVLVQGTAPLGWTMQPILRRIALLVQKRHGLEGHVFGGRYFSKLCRDADQLRNTIRYVHRNPVDAGLCAKPTDYAWSSARAWAGLEPCGHIAVEEGLRAFTCSPTGSIDELRASYLEMMSSASFANDSIHPELRTELPIREPRSRESSAPHLRDLHDAAKILLNLIDPEMDLDIVRSRYGGPSIVSARHQMIATLTQRKYTGVAISKYFRISPTAVARIRSQMRWATLERGQ